MDNNYENYKKAMALVNSTRKAKSGDIITSKGIKATIKDIHYQDYYKSDRNDGSCDWDIEFTDTNGNYRHWKQYFDGGDITLVD